MKYCYIRVSTDSQEFERQAKILKDNGFLDNINCKYIKEIYTGTKTSRPIYDKLIKNLKENDTLIVESLTRLSRAGIVETLREVSELVQNKKINVVIIKENFNLKAGEKPDANTNMLLGIFSVLAQFERDLISERTKEALASKKIKGTSTGRPIGKPRGKNTNKKAFINILKMLVNGEQLKKALETTKFPKRTYYNWLENYKDYYNTNDLKKIIEHLESEGK